MLVIWLVFPIVLIIYFIRREIMVRREIKYFEDRGIAARRSELFVFQLKEAMTENIAVSLDKLYKKYDNERLVGLFESNLPAYFIRDVSLAKHIMIKGFDHFTDHMEFFDAELDPLFGQSLISLHGQRWRAMRAALSPAFTGSKMRLMFQLVQQCSERMSNYFYEQCQLSGPKSYNIKDICSKFTNDAIASCAFGVTCDTFREPNNEFYRIGQNIVNSQSALNSLKFMIYSIFHWKIVGKLLNLKIIDDTSREIFTEVILNNMKTREEAKIFRPDMINLLMDLKKGQLKLGHEVEANESIATAEDHQTLPIDTKPVWNDEHLVPQCFIFFLAGFDTSSTLMTFVAYELAVNPDVQSRLLEEVDRTSDELSGNQLDYDHLQSMKYLDMVIAETLRKWPPAPVLERVCGKDYKYQGEDGFELAISQGSIVFLPVYSVHRDPRYFTDPEKFWPERFSPENRSSNDLNAFVPFGVGPRNCIGSRFALMEVKSIIYHLLLNFTFEVCEKTQVPVQLKKTMFGVLPEKVELLLKPRRGS